MVRVAPIKLQAGSRVLWFDPNENDIHKGDYVIVSTERGTEYGCASSDIMEVSDELVEQLKSPLKPVLRVATEEDQQRAEELAQKGAEALPVFKELAAQTNEDMHPVFVEFLFDGDKAVFYFEAEERVDFRELVRKLAAQFGIRVDMRQIGVRDGARIVGGLGHCGQELCCKRLGGEFSPVSIKMAKEQNLSLNPQKISGVCGRLMCCLRYEYETYKEFNAHAPKLNAKISLPEGVAKATEVNMPLERVTLQLEDGRSIKVPLEEMQTTEDSKRPNAISEEVFERYANTDKYAVVESVSSTEVASFTAEDKLIDRSKKPDAHAIDQHHEQKTKQQSSSRRSRKRKTNSQDQSQQTGTKANKKTQRSKAETSSSRSRTQGSSRNENRKPRKRTRIPAASGSTQNQKSNEKQQPSATRQANRPGQKSSGLRNPDYRGSSSANRQSTNREGVAHRKSRRRRHHTGGNTDEN